MDNIIIPERNIEKAKFVQVYLVNNGEREPFLRYDNTWGGYHSIILADLLRAKDIDHERIQIGGAFCPKPSNDRYELCGAGRFEFKDGLFTFWGCSSDYVLASNEEHFRELQALNSRFKFKIDRDRRS